MKVVWSTCDKERGDEMKSVTENYFKSSLENFQKSFAFRETYVRYLEKQFIGIVYSYITQLSLTICYEIKYL